MNKMKLFLILLVFLFASGCGKNREKIVTDKGSNNEIKESKKEEETIMNNKTIKAIINGIEYKVHLEEGNIVNEFLNILPLDITMIDLNNNEKYIYLDKKLPTNPFNPERINAGDIMLFGNNCLVIFYKSFDTTYSYTKIGHIDNLPVFNNDDIFVKFEK